MGGYSLKRLDDTPVGLHPLWLRSCDSCYVQVCLRKASFRLFLSINPLAALLPSRSPKARSGDRTTSPQGSPATHSYIKVISVISLAAFS